jgi:hypothetical protein
MKRLALLALLSVVAATAGVATTSATAAPPSAAATVTITPSQAQGVLDGVFQITDIVLNEAGQLVAEGVFTGTATIGGVTQTITSTASVVLVPAQVSGACSILDLDLGPLHLDLLGLVIDLDEVHLDITGQPGSGKLLGNLLCTVTGLLDNPGNAVQRLLDLINQLLG